MSTVTRNDAINAIKRVFDFVRVVTHFHRISESYRVILLTLVNVSKMTHWACESVSPHGQNWRLILWHLLHHLTQMLSTLSNLSESCDSIKDQMSQITHQICIRLLRSVSLYGQTKDSLQWVIWLSIYFLCGYSEPLSYVDDRPKKKRNRQRNITCFNPPFSLDKHWSPLPEPCR